MTGLRRRGPAGCGDDVDEVAQVAPEPVDPPDDQVVTGSQVGQTRRPLWPVGAPMARPGVGADECPGIRMRTSIRRSVDHHEVVRHCCIDG